ncbi:general substrate transporter [Dactylonectria macrodidyma]|uniref:General substrate transporter n=1 Tax=Dactylonectria macrodidyma TaxID=307937 RepID=A0A9P9JKH1_9HYPO|nr:general substrate transporter [Dactylonectria macrodidyma]
MALSPETEDKSADIHHIEAEDGDISSQKEWSHVQGQQGADIDRNMTVWQAIKMYPGAITWSFLLSSSIIMEGYDIVLIGNLVAQPAFQKAYGGWYGEKLGYQISGPWQSGLGNATAVGTIFGAFANGWLTQRFGYRLTLVASLAAVTGFIFITFFAQSLPMLLVGSTLCGLPWGVFATMAPAYASEICPMALRGYLANYVCLCWALGQLLAAGVLFSFESNSTQWAYRIPFALQWMWPIPLMIVLWFTPESPYWLARKNRLDDAKNVLRRISAKGSKSDEDLDKQLAMIVHTNKIESEHTKGSSYLDCFKGINLRRTEIVCMVFVAQNTTGVGIGGTPTYFFLQAGVDSSNAFKFATGALGLASVGVIISWALIYRIGRRTLYVWACGLCTMLMLLIGILATIPQTSAVSFGQAGLVLAWEIIFYATIGPVCYAIIGEIPAVSVRSKSICLARIAYYITQILNNTYGPYMINPTEGDWKGKVGYFWAGLSLLTFAWAFFRLPETKGRTFEEIDILFADKTSARKFSETKVDAYAINEEDRIVKGTDV